MPRQFAFAEAVRSNGNGNGNPQLLIPQQQQKPQRLQTAETYFASGKSTVSFDTYRVGEMDVVTREDAIKIGQQIR